MLMNFDIPNIFNIFALLPTDGDEVKWIFICLLQRFIFFDIKFRELVCENR